MSGHYIILLAIGMLFSGVAVGLLISPWRFKLN